MDSEEPSSLAEQFDESYSDEDENNSDLEATLYASVYYSEDLFNKSLDIPEAASITSIADVVNSWKNVSQKEKESEKDGCLPGDDGISSEDRNNSGNNTATLLKKNDSVLEIGKTSAKDKNASIISSLDDNPVGGREQEHVAEDDNRQEIPCKSSMVPMNNTIDNSNGKQGKGPNTKDSTHDSNHLLANVEKDRFLNNDRLEETANPRSNADVSLQQISEQVPLENKRLNEDPKNSEGKMDAPNKPPNEKSNSSNSTGGSSSTTDNEPRVNKKLNLNSSVMSSSDSSSSTSHTKSEDGNTSTTNKLPTSPKKLMSKSDGVTTMLLKSLNQSPTEVNTNKPSDTPIFQKASLESANVEKQRRMKGSRSNLSFRGLFVTSLSSSDCSSGEESKYKAVAKRKKMSTKERVESCSNKRLSSNQESNEIITIEDSDNNENKFEDILDSDESILEVPAPPKPAPPMIVLQDSENSSSSMDMNILDCTSSSHRKSNTSRATDDPEILLDDTMSAETIILEPYPLHVNTRAGSGSTVASSRSKANDPSSLSIGSEINSDQASVSPAGLASWVPAKSGVVPHNDQSDDSMTENEASNWGFIAAIQEKSQMEGGCEETNVSGKHSSSGKNDEASRSKDNASEPKDMDNEVTQTNFASPFARGEGAKDKSVESRGKIAERKGKTISRKADSLGGGERSSENRERIDETLSKSLDGRKRLLDAIDSPGISKKRARHSDGEAGPSTLGTKSRKENDKNRGNRRKSMSDYFFKPMTDEMKDFYNNSWGGENFDLDKIRSKMSKDERHWAVLDNDLLGSQRGRARYWVNGKCTNCQQPGHTRATCSEAKKIPKCYMCGGDGHKEPRCPHKICLTCGKKQRTYTKTCDSCKSSRCNMCHSRGHTGNNCPDLWRRYHQTPSQAQEKPNHAKTDRQEPHREVENETKQRQLPLRKGVSKNKSQNRNKPGKLKSKYSVQSILERSIDTNKLDKNQNCLPSFNATKSADNSSNAKKLFHLRNVQVWEPQADLDNFPDMSITIPNISKVSTPTDDNASGNIQVVQNNRNMSINESYDLYRNEYSVFPHAGPNRNETIQFDQPYIPLTNPGECFNSGYSYPMIPGTPNVPQSNFNTPMGNLAFPYQNPDIPRGILNVSQWNPNFPMALSNAHPLPHSVPMVPQWGYNFPNQYVQEEQRVPNLQDNQFVRYLNDPYQSNIPNIQGYPSVPMTDPNNIIQQVDMINSPRFSTGALQLIQSHISRNVINIPLLQSHAVEMNRSTTNLNNLRHTELPKFQVTNTSHSHIPNDPRCSAVSQLKANDRKSENQNRNSAGRLQLRPLARNILSLDPNDECEMTRLILFEAGNTGRKATPVTNAAQSTETKIKLENKKDIVVKKIKNEKKQHRNDGYSKDTATTMNVDIESLKRSSNENNSKERKRVESVAKVKKETKHNVARSLPNAESKDIEEVQVTDVKNVGENLLSQMILTPSKDALLRQTADGRDYLDSLASEFNCVIKIEENTSVPHLKVLSIYGKRVIGEVIERIKKWLKLPFNESTLGHANLPNDRNTVISILSERLRDLEGFLGTPLDCLENIDSLSKSIRELPRSADSDLRYYLTRSKLMKRLNDAKIKLNMILFGQAKLNGGDDLIYYLKTTLWTLKYVNKENRLNEELFKTLCLIYRRIFSSYIPTNLDDLLSRYNSKGYKSYYGN